MKTIKSTNMVYAGPEEEFFWIKDNGVVEEGEAVGYEVEVGSEIVLHLFEDIYHELKEEVF